MNKTTTFILAGVGSLLLIVVLFVVAIVGSLNSYSRIEVKAKALVTDNKNVLDNSRKRIQESAAVSKQEVDALLSIITGYAEKRGTNSAGNGALVTAAAIHEAVPGVTEVKTLQNLQNLLNGARLNWQSAQTRLVETKREGDEMLAVFPSSFVLPLFGKKPIDIVIVTSEATEENFRTGKDESSWVK